MTIGEQIKKLRKKQKMTMEDLASKISVSGKTVINDYESGRRNPSAKTLDKIAEALGCEVVILLKTIKK